MLTTLVFAAVVIFFLWLDLHSHSHDQPVTLKNAALWSLAWVGVSLAFAGYLYVAQGPDQAGLFTAGYLLEKSLSVDNLFVFIAIFASFKVKDALQHRILYYGIIGALVCRLLFISVGSAFLLAGDLNPILHMVVYTLFGGIVLFSAYSMLTDANDDPEDDEDYTQHWSVKLTKRIGLPVWPALDGHNFFTLQNGMRYATPLLLCLVVIETSDIAFAFDSVPAVISLTKVPLLVYTSNIFAILGLRSMYFLLSAAKRHLCHLEKAVVGILVFIGAKLLIEGFHDPIKTLLGFSLEISTGVSLTVVAGGLAAGILASWVFPEEEKAA